METKFCDTHDGLWDRLVHLQDDIAKSCRAVERYKTDLCPLAFQVYLRCKQAYEKVKNLKLFDSKDKRHCLFSKDNPFVIQDPINPESDAPIKIWSINTRRRAQTRLTALMYFAKQDLLHFNQKFRDAKKGLCQRLEELKQLRSEFNAAYNTPNETKEHQGGRE